MNNVETILVRLILITLLIKAVHYAKCKQHYMHTIEQQCLDLLKNGVLV